MMQESRKKGLCYFCEEKWHQSHKCIKPRLYLLEGIELLDQIVTESKVESQEDAALVEGAIDDYVDIASISLHAKVCAPSPKTMHRVGQLKKKWVVILVDTRSIQNFVDTLVTSKCNLSF